MQQWIWSGQMAILLGSFTFLVAFVPILIFQYRKFGRWSAIRMLGAAAVSVYIVAIATYTWLPLPPRTAEWCALNGIDVINTTPLAFMDDVRDVVQSVGRRQALRSTIVLQVVFNVILFIPWGIIVRRFFERGFIFTVLTGCIASVFIEATQATGLWGIYECAYRWADIDDVIMNTFGSFVGATIAPVLLFWMPRVGRLAETRLEAQPITLWRRLVSMLIVGMSVVTLNLVGIVTSRVVLLLLDRPIDGRLAHAAEAVIAIGVVGLLIYIPAIRGDGHIGMQTVWLAPRWQDENGDWGQGTLFLRFMRASVVAIPYLASALTSRNDLAILLWGIAGLSLVLVPFTRTRRSLSCVLTGAQLVDVRQQPKPD